MRKLGLREKKRPQVIVVKYMDQEPNQFSNIIRTLVLLVSRLPIVLSVQPDDPCSILNNLHKNKSGRALWHMPLIPALGEEKADGASSMI